MKLPHVALGDIACVTWGNTSITKSSYVPNGAIAFSATGPDGFLPIAEHDEKGIVLSAIGARCGRCFFATGKWTAIKNTITITSNQRDPVDMRYLWFYLNREGIWPSRGGGQPFIGLGTARAVEVPLPPLSEQKRIAGILDQADGLRRKRQQALALTDQFLRSTFLDLFGDPVTNPKRWPVQPVAKIANQVTDGEHITPERSTSGIKLISARNVRDGYLAFDMGVDFVSPTEFVRLRKRCEPRFGDVLISCSGTIGRVTSIKTHEHLAMVRSVALIRPKTEIVRSLYLEHYLRTDRMKSLMVQRAKSSSQANLFQGPIRELPILVPPQPIQERFETIVAHAQQLADRLANSSDSFASLFNSLVQRAFRGEL